MKSVYLAIILTILLPLIHLPFNNSDTQWYILTMSDRVIAFVWCVSFFLSTPKKYINLRSLLAVAVIFTGLRICYYALWLNTGVNDLFVYPVAFVLSIFFFCLTLLKSYNYKSDPVSSENITLCFWKPENNTTIFYSLIGAAIGSVALYHDKFLYGFCWSNNRYMIRELHKKTIAKRFITIDTGIKMNGRIRLELKKIIGADARCFDIKFLRLKCVYSIRTVLSILGPQFKPFFFEYVPSLYALKIFKWRYEKVKK